MSIKNTPKKTINSSIVGTIIIVILALITLPKAGNISWITPILSLAMIIAMFVFLFDKAQITSSLSKVDKAWFGVWIAYTSWALIQYFVIPSLVSWNSTDHMIPGLSLAHRPVNGSAAIESWVVFNTIWSFTFLVSKIDITTLKKCIVTILLITVFQALYGTIANINGQQTILGIWDKLNYTTSATGSFVNHNHYANYIAVATPLLIGYLLSQYTYLKALFSPLYRYLIVGLICVIMCTALIASLSRMGVAAGLFGIIGILILFLIRYIKIHSAAKISLVFGFILCLFFVMNFIGIETLVDRYQRVFIFDMRWSIWSATGDLPLSLWLFGSGGGSFADVFWVVHPPTTPKTAYYAHNDYIQFLIEYGIAGTLIFCATGQYWLKTVAHSGQSLIKSGCLFSMLVMALHSTVDFSLHIPANALLFWFCVGCYLNQNLSRSADKDRSEVISIFNTPFLHLNQKLKIR